MRPGDSTCGVSVAAAVAAALPVGIKLLSTGPGSAAPSTTQSLQPSAAGAAAAALVAVAVPSAAKGIVLWSGGCCSGPWGLAAASGAFEGSTIGGEEKAVDSMLVLPGLTVLPFVLLLRVVVLLLLPLLLLFATYAAARGVPKCLCH